MPGWWNGIHATLKMSWATLMRVRVPPRVQVLVFLRRKFYTVFSVTKPLIRVQISRSAIVHNFSVIAKQFPEANIMPVLKSNAYGHGARIVAGALSEKQFPFFVVDSINEAMELRATGEKRTLLIIGYVEPKSLMKSRLSNIVFSIVGIEQLQEISRQVKKQTDIHLKIDTGMHRQGIAIKDIPRAVAIIKGTPKLNLLGTFSHFADADGVNEAQTREQIEKWKGALSSLKAQFPQIKYVHIANTAGTYFHEGAIANTIRLGIGLYGFNPSKKQLDLIPALRVISKITSIKDILPGDGVGYNKTFIAESPRRIATVPIGYAEGLDRKLSNKGFMMVQGVACPIIGRISMNITSIDVTGVAEAEYGDEVVVMSDDAGAKNSVAQIAEDTGTIPYEVLVRLSPMLHREIV